MKMFIKKQKNKLTANSYLLKASHGFTLIELLLAMAIIAIMSGAILMSMGQQRKKANQSRFLAEFSSIMQPILMCRSDGYQLTAPNGGAGGGAICNGHPEYGYWPSTASTDFGNYTSPNASATGMNDGVWYFSISDGVAASDVKICCNSTSSKCHTLPASGAGSTCSETVPSL